MQNLLSPADIAARCGLSRQHVHALFKKYGKPEAAFANHRLTIYQESSVIKWLKSVMEGKYVEQFRTSAAVATQGE